MIEEFLHRSFIHGEHNAFREHMENNPVHPNFDGSLEQGIELVINRKRTMSDIAPTLIILLQNGAKLTRNYLMKPGMITPYHVICRSTGDHQELLELMIKELGLTSINARDYNECTALIYAVQNANIKCVKCLIANGADVNLINDKRNFADVNTGVALIDSIKLLNPESPHPYNTMMSIFDLLLDNGADVNKPCSYQNRTPIMYAIPLGNVNCIKKLFEKGAQVNYTDSAGQTLWTLAACVGSVDVLKCLIEDHGIDKNSTDEQGLSVLYWAVSGNNIEAVRYLLNLGVKITSFVPQECVESCRNCGTNLPCYYPYATEQMTDPYMFAIRRNMVDAVRLMDEWGCELYKSTHILSYAIHTNSVDVVGYLLCNYKYPLNYEYTERYTDYRCSGHQTFLIKACETQSVNLIKLLLEHGADPNKKCCGAKFPGLINVAIYVRHVEIIACMIRKGVNVNTRSYHPSMGRALPFEVAVCDNHIYAAEMLLVSGCSRGVNSWNNSSTLNSNISREMQELLKEWNVHKDIVLPLKQRCRMVILNRLCPQADMKIAKLPLPPQLIKYLSIPELDDIVESLKHQRSSHYYVS